MRVCFGTFPNGDHFARTTVPVLGGHVQLTARVTQAELREMYRAHRCDSVGFKLSFKTLGRAMGAIAKPATLLKLTAMSARLYAGDPTALTMAPGLVGDIKAGMAAKRVMAKASSGDPIAIKVVEQARAAASGAEPLDLSAATSHADRTMRYLVTVQKLGLAA